MDFKSIISKFKQFISNCLSFIILFVLKKRQDLKILHLSENFIVVDKKYDLLINSDSPEDKTVQTQIKAVHPELVVPKLVHDFYFIHRLDYATSGIMCLALHKLASSQASLSFSKRKVDKFYLAIVRGHVSLNMFQIKMPIGENEKGFPPMASERNGQKIPNARSAWTQILVLERGECYGYPATKVLLKPVTGRRHQLRVHLSDIGHTIVGDFTYSNRRDKEPHRMFLHAFSIDIPTKLERIHLQTNDPFTPSDLRNRWTPVQKLVDLGPKAMTSLSNEAHWTTVIS